MKKIIIILALIGLFYNSHAQSNRSISGSETGIILTVSGVGFAIGGFTTRPEKFYTSSGAWQVKPFHRQGARASAIVCGISLTVTGLISSIINAPKRR